MCVTFGTIKDDGNNDERHTQKKHIKFPRVFPEIIVCVCFFPVKFPAHFSLHITFPLIPSFRGKNYYPKKNVKRSERKNERRRRRSAGSA